MTLSTASVLLLLLAAPGRAPRFEQGRALFTQGDFDGALKALDGAALESQDPAVLEKVHLLRGQCFAARQEFAQAEEAFFLALSANPDATLDPARVDPTVVKVLDSVRARQTGVLVVTSTPPGASVEVDGRRQGKAPVSVTLPIGKHRVEGAFDGAEVQADTVVYPHRESRVGFVRVPGAAGKGGGDGGALSPFAEVRGAGEVSSLKGAPLGYGLEFGGGAEVGHFRLGATARLFPYFGLVPRAAFFVPVHERVHVFFEASVPVWFHNGGLATGVGAALGGEFLANRFLGAFVELGGEHLLLNPGTIDNTHFVATLGLRLRVP